MVVLFNADATILVVMGYPGCPITLPVQCRVNCMYIHAPMALMPTIQYRLGITAIKLTCIIIADHLNEVIYLAVLNKSQVLIGKVASI